MPNTKKEVKIMSESFIKTISALILAFVVFINSIGNIIGVGDIIPTQPAEEPTTVVETTEEETDIDPDALTEAELAVLINSETAKIVENGSYDYNRNCGYTDPIDVGAATDILNNLISSISDGRDDINSVVGYFLGIGTKQGTVPEDYLESNYKLKASALTEADIQNLRYSEGVYTFTLADVSNPQKDNSTSFARFTNDFVTHQEVVEGVADAAGSIIEVKETNANYNNIKVSVKVEDGKITNIKYSYTFDASINLKAAVVNVKGTGAVATNAEFSNIEY